MSTVSPVQKRWRWILVLAATGAALLGFCLSRQLDREVPLLASGTWLPLPKVIADFALIDARGRP
jgi:hypothetical protein